MRSILFAFMPVRRECLKACMLRSILFAFMLPLFAIPAFAGLNLQSFSCNSQSGMVTVETGASFNCEAVLKNDGSSTTNITGVSLSLPSPVWAESAVYSGTDYSSTVQGGATTTVTFSGIKPVLSGSHNFNILSVTPSGALDLDLASAITVNSVSINTVELSKPASAASGARFTVGATVTIGGTLPVTATISITGGSCSLVSGESAARSMGTIGNGVPSAVSWALTQGSSGGCAFTVTASSGTYSPKSSSGSVALTASTVVVGDTAPTGGSSGGAPAVAEGVKETKSIASIVPGSPALVSFSKPELSVSELRLEVLSRLTNVSVSVEKLDSRPASISSAPAGNKVYKYLDISSNLPRANLSRVKIKFKVERSWIASNNFSTSTVYLNRYSSGWNKLPTSFLNSDSAYSYFESESPGFSTFAITGEKPAVSAPAPVEQPKPPEQAPSPIAPTPTGLAPAISVASQSDIDSVRNYLNSVVPKTEQAKALLEQARAKLSEAQSALNKNEQARAKQLLDEARRMVREAEGIRAASITQEKIGLLTILLAFLALAAGTYAYYSRPQSRSSASEAVALAKERNTIIQMKKNAEREYLARKMDPETYKKLLADYEGRLVEVNTRIERLSQGNN